MSAFMSDDPQAGSYKTGPEGVNCPKGELGSAVEEWMGQFQNLGSDESIQVGSGLVEGGQGGEVSNTDEETIRTRNGQMGDWIRTDT